jgi:hypothetical protein
MRLRVPWRRRKRTIFDWLLFALALGAIIGVSWATLSARPDHHLVAKSIDRVR